jgi:hypothetical protein
MQASIWAHLLLVSSAAAQASSSPSVSTITAAPSSESGVPAALIGSQYVPQLGTSTTYYCPVGQIFSTKGRYAACCTDDPYQECQFAVSCESTSLLRGPEGAFTLTCSGTSSQTVCITGLVYESTSGTAAVTNVQCWSTWDGGSWVATKAASTSVATGSLPLGLKISSTLFRSNDFVAASNTLVTTTTTDNLPSQTGQPSASSPVPIGAIIGGVIGGLALLTFLGACLWFTCSRRGQATRRKWPSESSIFNSVCWGKGSDRHRERKISEKTLTQEEERRATLAPEVIEEAGGRSVVMMVDDEPNVGRLSKEMHAEAREVTAGNTAAAQTMGQGTGDDAASAKSAASFQSALAHHVG